MISVENISKKYVIAHQRSGEGLRHVLNDAIRDPFKSLKRLAKRHALEEFWALQDVSFNVGQGEVIGVIGRNGAGKSTLLKILSRITKPTEGRVRLRGRVAS